MQEYQKDPQGSQGGKSSEGVDISFISRYPEADRLFISRAFELASQAHAQQKRLSGEPYATHLVAVARYLAELGLDPQTIAAGFLHDTLEDTTLTAADLEKEFGSEVAFLVQGVTKIKTIEHAVSGSTTRSREEHLNSIKKMFFAMAEDVRVILIKLMDRLHNLQTIAPLSPENQRRIASETMEIYAPIASRLSLGSIRGQLEDLSFPILYPTEYSWLKGKIKERFADRLRYVEKAKKAVLKHLGESNIPVIEVQSRAKHLYSLYQKMVRDNVDLDKVYDLVAIRIIVPDIKSCYETLGIIHQFYVPLAGRIKDYIAMPKPNGYQSLHTTVFCEKGKIVEIQIRTPEMHRHAELGIASHWAYTEGGKRNTHADHKELEWINQLKEFLKDVKNSESFEALKPDFFKTRIFVFTPKGDVEDLPEGATPIDLAYAIHTNLGHSLRGAKVNGKMVSIDYPLRNGDVVEIIKGKEIKPSRDWLGIVKTNEARRRIKSWFNQ